MEPSFFLLGAIWLGVFFPRVGFLSLAALLVLGTNAMDVDAFLTSIGAAH